MEKIEDSVIALLLFGVACFIVILVSEWLSLNPTSLVAGIALYVSIYALVEAWKKEDK